MARGVGHVVLSKAKALRAVSQVYTLKLNHLFQGLLVIGTGEDIIRSAFARGLCERLCADNDDVHDVLTELLQTFCESYIKPLRKCT
jgi:hypothetical protein